MRIGIISDLHLGYRQYGLEAREKDFYDIYLKCIDKIVEEKCHIVIIAGDIFDNHKPSPIAIRVFAEGLSILNQHGIVVYNIIGNHTQLQTRDHFEPDHLFEKKYDYHVLSGQSRTITNNISIAGIQYYANHSLDQFKEEVSKLNEKVKDTKYNILVIHQEFQEYCGFTGAHMSIKDLELDNFKTVVCGHIHSRFVDYDKNIDVVFLQPGSIERLNTTESQNEIEVGKGITIIETDSECNASIRFVRIGMSRKIFSEAIATSEDPKNTISKFESLYEKIDQDDSNLKPILHLKVVDKYDQFDLCKDWEKNFSDITLMTRMVYQNQREIQMTNVYQISGEELTPLNGLKRGLEDWDDDTSDFVIELFKRLSSGDKDIVDSAKNLIDEFYEKKYPGE